MKQHKHFGRKVFSVFMAMLMVMTAWVFVAPQKAQAATEGTYNVKVRYEPSNGAYSEDEVMRLNYKTNNGMGELGQLSQDFKNDGSSGTLDKPYEFIFTNVPGFPVSAEIYCSGLWWFKGEVVYGVKIWVQDALENWILVRNSDWRENPHGYRSVYRYVYS